MLLRQPLFLGVVVDVLIRGSQKMVDDDFDDAEFAVMGL